MLEGPPPAPELVLVELVELVVVVDEEVDVAEGEDDELELAGAAPVALLVEDVVEEVDAAS